MQLTKGASMAWSLLAKGKEPQVVAEALAFFSHKPKEETEAKLLELIQQMLAAGYLIEEDDIEK
ncbi:MAG: hypothetical protein J5637_08205 [Prevotella sp.]|nr:hypothetical protein [Prevotella sp.]